MKYHLKGRISRVLAVMFAVLFCMTVSGAATTAEPSADSADVNILLPYPVQWIAEAAKTVYAETGLKVHITIMFSGPELMYLLSISELEQMWSENLPQELKTGKYDIIYMPSAYTNAIKTDNFTNLYDPFRQTEFDMELIKSEFFRHILGMKVCISSPCYLTSVFLQ